MQDERGRSREFADRDQTDRLPVLNDVQVDPGAAAAAAAAAADERNRLPGPHEDHAPGRPARTDLRTPATDPAAQLAQLRAQIALAHHELDVVHARTAAHREVLQTREWRRAYRASVAVDPLDRAQSTGATATVAATGAVLPILMPEESTSPPGVPCTAPAEGWWQASVEADHQRALAERDARLAEQSAQIEQLREALRRAAVRIATLEAGRPYPDAPPTAAASGWSLVRLDLVDERTLELSGRTRIGRGAGCEIVLDSLSVSRQHALLLVDDQGAIIEDLNSTNGVHVNGRKIKRSRLRDGDAVTIGDAKFRVAGPGGARPETQRR
ncbi:MAG TPA: FHA domain-containing protein [Steroidobacteraceae bacterium]|nr:FHA domain-containing protein [Steroidobacteraceae bacterium]